MSNFWNPDENNSDNDSDEEEVVAQFNGRDGLIFLIDADESITGNRDQFQTCLECIESVMLNTVMNSPKNLLGMVFYNTEHSPSPKYQVESDFKLEVPKNIAIFLPLLTMSKDIIQYIKNFKESSDSFDFKTKYGTSKTSSFCDALWLCSRMFRRCGYKLQDTTIILFTNNEMPHPTGSHELQKSFVRAKDLNDWKTQLILAPLVDEFDAVPFYQEFICTVMDYDPSTWTLINPVEQRQMLACRRYQKDYRRACNRYFTMTMGDGLACGVGIYNFKNTSVAPKPVRLVRDSNKIAVGRVSYKVERLDEDGANVTYDNILPGELRRYQMIGGRKLYFSSEELTQMKALVSPGMLLLGFKPMKTLQSRYFLRSTRFLYPSEKIVKGSSRLFRALWEKCLEKQVYALCVFCQVRKSPPRYVALVPEQENPDGNDGFRVVYLPTQTNIRELKIFDHEIPLIEADGIGIFKKIIKKLKFKYNEKLFENPNLQMFYSNLEALVYDQECAPYEDTTMPDVNEQDNIVGSDLEQLSEMFGKDCAVASKRPAVSKASGEQAPKVPKITTNLTRQDITDAITCGSISKLTVTALKEFLQTEGVYGCSKLTKPYLIEKCKEICGI